MGSPVYLVRHAKAGERHAWTGDDRERPLSKKGWKQADAVAARLGALEVTGLWSSPYVRCVQTLEPLAKLAGLSVEIDHRLAEDEPFEPVLDLLRDTPRRSVLCSHGDIIPSTLAALQRRGAEIRTPPDWRKASVWVLDRNKHGEIVRATVWPPPLV